jgi:hypothetical protein
VTTLYDTHFKYSTRPSLRDYSNLLQAAVQNLSKTFIIIDALDECPELDENRTSFLKEIRELQPNAHLFFTSRPERMIELEFQNAAHLEILASDDDIANYIEARIPSSSHLNRHLERDPTLRKVIIDTVIGTAKGM